MMGRVSKRSKKIWIIILSAIAILFVCYGVQYFCKKMFFTELSALISVDAKGSHSYQILKAIEFTKANRTKKEVDEANQFITTWSFNPIDYWWALIPPLTFLISIIILIYLCIFYKKKVKEKLSEIEEKAGEYKRDNDYKNDRIHELGKDLRNCEAWNQSLKERIAPLDDAAKQVQTKLKEIEAEYLQETQAKDKAHAEELSLYKEATMTKLVEIEKLKKEMEELKKQRSDEIIL